MISIPVVNGSRERSPGRELACARRTGLLLEGFCFERYEQKTDGIIIYSGYWFCAEYRRRSDLFAGQK